MWVYAKRGLDVGSNQRMREGVRDEWRPTCFRSPTPNTYIRRRENAGLKQTVLLEQTISAGATISRVGTGVVVVRIPDSARWTPTSAGMKVISSRWQLSPGSGLPGWLLTSACICCPLYAQSTAEGSTFTGTQCSGSLYRADMNGHVVVRTRDHGELCIAMVLIWYSDKPHV